MRSSLAGFSSVSTAHPMLTYNQFGGTGAVRMKTLALPSQLNLSDGPWTYGAFVSIDPGEGNEIGEQTQEWDMLYSVLEGQGTFTIDSVLTLVKTGCVVGLPHGTPHVIRNGSEHAALSVLSIGLQTFSLSALTPFAYNLAAQLCPGETFAPIYVENESIYTQVATLNLATHFLDSFWRSLSLVELPPGASIDDYAESRADQLWVLSGQCSAFVTKRFPPASGEVKEELRIDGTDDAYQCLIVPAGILCRVEVPASSSLPARLLHLTVFNRRW